MIRMNGWKKTGMIKIGWLDEKKLWKVKIYREIGT
jgi:hypothetical protein